MLDTTYNDILVIVRRKKSPEDVYNFVKRLKNNQIARKIGKIFEKFAAFFVISYQT